MRQYFIDERRLEFAFEGQRWLDLVRLGKMVEVMQAHCKNSTQEYHQLLPILQHAIDTNTKLKQNEDYR